MLGSQSSHVRMSLIQSLGLVMGHKYDMIEVQGLAADGVRSEVRQQVT